jgi:hypothetical protein
MGKHLVVAVVLAMVAVVACTKSKAKSGEKCEEKADCAEGLGCYIITGQFRCFTHDEADAVCKATSDCKTRGKCRAVENSTQATDPKYYMGGCQ